VLMQVGLITIFAGFCSLAILWAVALVAIWRDADETYGTGLFWGICVLVAPLAAIPAYLLMRIGTHRSWREELAALDRYEARKRLGVRFGGQAGDLDRQLKSGVKDLSLSAPMHRSEQPRREGYTICSAPIPKDFTPFRASFAAPVEKYRQRKYSAQRGSELSQQ